jgi:hypothetical protein
MGVSPIIPWPDAAIPMIGPAVGDRSHQLAMRVRRRKMMGDVSPLAANCCSIGMDGDGVGVPVVYGAARASGDARV